MKPFVSRLYYRRGRHSLILEQGEIYLLAQIETWYHLQNSPDKCVPIPDVHCIHCLKVKWHWGQNTGLQLYCITVFFFHWDRHKLKLKELPTNWFLCCMPFRIWTQVKQCNYGTNRYMMFTYLLSTVCVT